MFFGGDPFEHFAHMGGGGSGGGSGRSRGPSKPVDNNKFYDTLGVSKEADESEIRKSYRKLALKHHPDRGGDPEKFKEIQHASEVLLDADKRKKYDQYGEEGLEGGEGGGGGADDILSHFFGGGGSRRERGPSRTEDINHTIKVSLEDMYNGKTSKLAISRNKPCTDCEGRGGKVGCEKSCSTCSGRGVRISLRQIGPGMVQQMQSTCSDCRGSGNMIDEKDKCRSCNGSKVYKDRKILEVNIEKGMKHGQKIKFTGESDELPNTIPGDVVIVVQEKDHDVFKRKGADLVINMTLQLSEALCGFVKTITHLDGRVLKIESPPGQVIKHDAVRVVQGEGMPYHGNPFTKGRLFIHFKVEFPKTLPVRTVSVLDSVLPKVAPPTLTGEEEECLMTDIDLSQFGQSDTGRNYDATGGDDDDEGGGPQRVQCGQA